MSELWKTHNTILGQKAKRLARKKKSRKTWVCCSSIRTQSRMYVFQYCLTANTRISDSCLIFADNQNLHHTDGGFSSLIFSPTWLQLSALSPQSQSPVLGSGDTFLRAQCKPHHLSQKETLEQDRLSTLQVHPSSKGPSAPALALAAAPGAPSARLS